MLQIERKRPAKWLMGFGPPLSPIARSRASRSCNRRTRLCGTGLCRLARTCPCIAFLAALIGLATRIGTFPRDCGKGEAGLAQVMVEPSRAAAGLALPWSPAEMDGAAGLYVHVERAKYLGLVMLPDRLRAVVGEKGTEVRASLKTLELNGSALGYMRNCHRMLLPSGAGITKRLRQI